MDTKKLNTYLAEAWPENCVGGIATTAMLLASGISDKAITSGVREHLLVRLHRGSYLLAAVWQGLKPWEREDAMLTGHVLASNSQGVYSHSSAARLHGLATWGTGAAVHVTHGYAPGSRGHGAGVTVHEQRLAPEQFVMMQRGPVSVPVTSMAQTVLDCARLYDLERSVVIGDHALRTGLPILVLQNQLALSHVKRGSARARRMLAFIDPRSESAGESRSRVFMAGAKIPMPDLQVEIRTRHGLHRADFAWREYRLILEFDGWGKYFLYRPTAEALAMERQREKDLMELGWRFIRITWRDLNDPVALATRIRTALLAAGAKLPMVRTTVGL